MFLGHLVRELDDPEQWPLPGLGTKDDKAEDEGNGVTVTMNIAPQTPLVRVESTTTTASADLTIREPAALTTPVSAAAATTEYGSLGPSASTTAPVKQQLDNELSSTDTTPTAPDEQEVFTDIGRLPDADADQPLVVVWSGSRLGFAVPGSPTSSSAAKDERKDGEKGNYVDENQDEDEAEEKGIKENKKDEDARKEEERDGKTEEQQEDEKMERGERKVKEERDVGEREEEIEKQEDDEEQKEEEEAERGEREERDAEEREEERELEEQEMEEGNPAGLRLSLAATVDVHRQHATTSTGLDHVDFDETAAVVLMAKLDPRTTHATTTKLEPLARTPVGPVSDTTATAASFSRTPNDGTSAVSPDSFPFTTVKQEAVHSIVGSNTRAASKPTPSLSATQPIDYVSIDLGTFFVAFFLGFLVGFSMFKLRRKIPAWLHEKRSTIVTWLQRRRLIFAAWLHQKSMAIIMWLSGTQPTAMRRLTIAAWIAGGSLAVLLVFDVVVFLVLYTAGFYAIQLLGRLLLAWLRETRLAIITNLCRRSPIIVTWLRRRLSITVAWVSHLSMLTKVWLHQSSSTIVRGLRLAAWVALTPFTAPVPSVEATASNATAILYTPLGSLFSPALNKGGLISIVENILDANPEAKKEVCTTLSFAILCGVDPTVQPQSVRTDGMTILASKRFLGG